MSDLPSFLTASFPEYKTPPPPRLQSLYSDIYRQKESNPEGFKSSIGWWTRVLECLVRAGQQPQSNDRLVLHASNELIDALRWEKAGRPLGLGAVLEDLTLNKSVIALPTFLKLNKSIYYQSGVAYRVAAFVLGGPLWWALGQLSIVGDGTATVTSEERWANYRGDYVVLSILKEAGDAVSAHQRQKPPNFTEALYTRQSFVEEFDSQAVKGARLSDLDLDILLKYLERDRNVLVVEGSNIKFIDPEDADAIAEGITDVDVGVLEMKTTLQMLANQIEEIERQIEERMAKIGELLRKGSKSVALTYLRSKKMLEELLTKRLRSQETLQNVLNKIETAATDVEIMKAYDTSAKTLQTVLKHPLLQVDSIDQTMENMAEALANHKEIDDAIGLGNEGVAAAAGVPEADDSELADELEALVREQKKEEEEQKTREAKMAQEKAEVEKALELEKATVPSDSSDSEWEKRYEDAQGEKAAQAMKDREAELQLRERWEKIERHEAAKAT